MKNNPLPQALNNFLDKYFDPTKPILLGLSGGPDSLSLLHLLLQLRKTRPITLAVAHVDHGWRPESSSEAEQLRTLVQQQELPFHLRTLSPLELQGNLEAACREERIRFFQTLCLEHGYQAVLLGHQADDQAETVLKRILEGASLNCLTALQEVTHIDGINLWRPLLPFRKTQILEWLVEQQLTAFNDYTNLDPKYLRGRFRSQILPELSKAFGKEILGNLCHLAEEAQELKEHMQQSLECYLDAIEPGPWGVMLDLSSSCPASPFALKYLLRAFLQCEGLCPSRQLLETACSLMLDGKGDRQLPLGQHILQVDRKRLFLLKRPVELVSDCVVLKPGKMQYGPWQVTVTVVESSENKLLSDWKDVWKGRTAITWEANEGDYHLGPPKMGSSYPGKNGSLSRWWTDEKVPAFLRHSIPVIWQGDRICGEFLSGRTPQREALTGLHYRIDLFNHRDHRDH